MQTIDTTTFQPGSKVSCVGCSNPNLVPAATSMVQEFRDGPQLAFQRNRSSQSVPS